MGERTAPLVGDSLVNVQARSRRRRKGHRLRQQSPQGRAFAEAGADAITDDMRAIDGARRSRRSHADLLQVSLPHQAPGCAPLRRAGFPAPLSRDAPAFGPLRARCADARPCKTG
ncbi:hypothetical protein GCM10017750_29710 [Streptomyces racemochromogenes]